MKLIIGLGNPGKNYRDSRHNIGSYIVEALSKRHKVLLKKDNLTFSLNGKAIIKETEVIVAKPLAFMNLSGKAVAALLKKYRIDLKNVLVVCDDIDLEFGRLKIRPGGSSGGHKGLGSVINYLGTSEFSRLRIGIGRSSGKKLGVAEYVLSAFTGWEKKMLKEVKERAGACCELWLDEGITRSMDVFNRRSRK